MLKGSSILSGLVEPFHPAVAGLTINEHAFTVLNVVSKKIFCRRKLPTAPAAARLIQNPAACCLLRRKRSDDLIKARVSSQRVPNRIETQIAVAQTAPRQLRCLGQSFDCAIVVARPCINDCQVLHQERALGGAFSDGY